MTTAECCYCDRCFETKNGLDMHLNRTHPQMDPNDFGLHFLNLNPEQQADLINIARPDTGYVAPQDMTPIILDILSEQNDTKLINGLRDEIARMKGWSYRYTIREEP